MTDLMEILLISNVKISEIRNRISLDYFLIESVREQTI